MPQSPRVRDPPLRDEERERFELPQFQLEPLEPLELREPPNTPPPPEREPPPKKLREPPLLRKPPPPPLRDPPPLLNPPLFAMQADYAALLRRRRCGAGSGCGVAGGSGSLRQGSTSVTSGPSVSAMRARCCSGVVSHAERVSGSAASSSR